jgi:hypothetical protein
MDRIALSLKLRRFIPWLDDRCQLDGLVKRAEQIGCSILVSETLTMLEHSLRNLQRAGFQKVYDKEVCEWNA